MSINRKIYPIIAWSLTLASCGGILSETFGSRSGEEGEGKDDKDSDSDYRSGEESVPIAGNYLTFDNGDIRCDFQPNGAEFRIYCNTVVVSSDGSEAVAEAVDPQLKLEWAAPKITTGQVEKISCEVAKDQLAQNCELRTTSDSVKLEFELKFVDKANQQEKAETTEVQLPYAVGVAAGLVPSIPYLYKELGSSSKTADTSKLGSELRLQGFQRRTYPAIGFRLQSHYICSSKLGTFFDFGSSVFRLASGRISLYGAVVQVGKTDTVTLACDDKSLYISVTGLNWESRIYAFKEGRLKHLAGATNLNVGTTAAEGSTAVDGPVRYGLGMTAAPDGTVYFSEILTNRIKKITPEGKIFTVAGTGMPGFSGDGGAAMGAALNQPERLFFAQGNLYIADAKNHRVRRIDANGIITTVAGGAGSGFAGDGGPALEAKLNAPSDVIVKADGSILICDHGNNRIRLVNPQGVISTLVGSGALAALGSTNNTASRFPLYGPNSMGFNDKGALMISEIFASRIVKVAADDQGLVKSDSPVSVEAGIPDITSNLMEMVGEGKNAVDVHLSSVGDIAIGGDGSIYYSDYTLNMIRKINQDGTVRTLAGRVAIDVNRPPTALWTRSFPGSMTGNNGPASAALLNQPKGMAFAKDGSLYFADSGNNCIRKIAATDKIIDGNSVITGIAGACTSGQFEADDPVGRARDIILNQPAGINFDAAGNLFIANRVACEIVRLSVDADGQISENSPAEVIAGTQCSLTHNGDGGPAINAELYFPSDVIPAADGSLYIADYGHSLIRKMLPDANGVLSGASIITSVALSGAAGSLTITPKTFAFADGGLLVSDELSANIIMLKDKGQRSTDGKLTIIADFEFYLGTQKEKTCGSGRVSNASIGDDIDAAIRSSLSNICRGRPTVIAGTESARVSKVVYVQEFGSTPQVSNIIEIVKGKAAK